MGKEKHARYEVSQGVVIENAKGEILLIKLHNGDWALPGGHLHEHEDWLDGLEREIFEETGIKNLNIYGVLGVSIVGTAYGVCFHGTLQNNGDIAVVLSDEHEDFAWVSSKEDVSNYSFCHPALRDFVLQVLEKRHLN